MTLYHDIPHSQGVENALRRAKQLVEFSWTPVKMFPVGQHMETLEGQKRDEYYFEAWKPKKGIVYSSVRKTDKFVGFGVSLETYAAALSNPRSVIYTHPQYEGLSVWNYYGVVCSVYVSYVLDLPFRRSCGSWTNYPDCIPVDSSCLENLQLCDVLLNPITHVAIITDIERDVNGKVHYITVSESASPVCISTRYSVRDFLNYWPKNGYSIYRHANLDKVTYTPSPYIPLPGDPDLEAEINPSLQPDFGDKANYMLGETVELDVLEEGWTSVHITGPEEHALPVEDGKVVFTPAVPGYYTAYCTNDSGASKPVEFCITNLTLSCDKTVWKAGESLSMAFQANAPEDQLLGWMIHNPTDNLKGADLFTLEECEQGTAVIHGVGKCAPKADTPLVPGEYYIFALARNKFGIYRSAGFDFRAE